jgi:hypothetical protein
MMRIELKQEGFFDFHESELKLVRNLALRKYAFSRKFSKTMKFASKYCFQIFSRSCSRKYEIFAKIYVFKAVLLCPVLAVMSSLSSLSSPWCPLRSTWDLSQMKCPSCHVPTPDYPVTVVLPLWSRSGFPVPYIL